MIGLSEGILTVLFKYLCMFFPRQEAFVTSFTKPFNSAFVNGWFYFGEHIVNRNATQLEKAQKFYDLTIAQNVVNLSVVMGISLTTGFVVFIFISFSINFTEAKKESEALVRNNKTEEEVELEANEDKKESKETYIKNIKKIFHSSTYWSFF